MAIWKKGNGASQDESGEGRGLIGNPEILLAEIYYYQKVGDTKQAEQGYKDMLSRYPGNADALNNYGVFLCGNARYAEADRIFHASGAGA